MPGVGGVAVQMQGHPFNARLQAWGRSSSQWFGLIIWEQRVIPDWEPKNITTLFSAWTPAGRVSLEATPAIPGDTKHLGLWLTGDDIPDIGLKIVRLPKWRDLA